jgi:hypothetical protein
MIRTIFLAAFLMAIFLCESQAQEKFERMTEIALAFTLDAPDMYDTWRPGFGIGLNRRLTKRSGFETGLYYRNYEQVLSRSDGMSMPTLFANLNERNLMIPLLYRFQNTWIHVSLGPTFDFFTGWRQTRDLGLNVETYSRRPSVDMGAMVKIGVPLELSDKVKVLPEMRFNPTFQFYRLYAGVGFTLWYNP